MSNSVKLIFKTVYKIKKTSKTKNEVIFLINMILPLYRQKKIILSRFFFAFLWDF